MQKKQIPSENFIYLIEIICPDNICRTLLNDKSPLIYDHGHFTAKGSEWVVEEILKKLNSIDTNYFF